MKPQSFPPQFFKRNRQALLERSGQDVIVIAAAGLMQRSADTTFPFHQDRNFWYLTGLNEPDVILVLSKKSSFLVVPRRSASRIAFDGAGNADNALADAGIEHVYNERQGWEYIHQLTSRVKTIGILGAPSSYMAPYGFYTNPARQRLVLRLKRRFPGHTLVEVQDDLHSLRAIKQPEEIQALTKAIRITTDALQLVRKDLEAYSTEYEIEAFLSGYFRANGGSGHAFEPILASGQHATTLHYIDNNGVLEKGKLVVCDVGAQADEYCADVTRTFGFGKPTRRQKDVHAAVLTVQNAALALLKPGTEFHEYEKAVGKLMRQELVKLGLITSAEDRESAWRYYPHATSHFLGLDVHDVGNYRLPIAEGMVLTCEPGIYIAEEGIGVRIEDDVLITAHGYQLLSDCSNGL
jgi:Xaa-Pro aminopeptidase